MTEDPRSSTKRFLLISAAAFVLVACLTHLPVFLGRVPFPSEIITNFPPWNSVRSDFKIGKHGELADTPTLFYPFRYFSGSALRQGTVPLWNKRILAGTPFVADAQSAVFYPLNLLDLLPSAPIAWTIKIILNVILSGLFTALLVRALGGSTYGAIGAGVIYSCCGFNTAWQGSTPLADGTIWLPLILYAVHKLCALPTVGSVLLAGVAFAMPVLAGHPETALHMTMAGTAFALFQCFFLGGGVSPTGQRLVRFGMAGILAMGLAAVQMLPTLEWLREIFMVFPQRWAFPPGQLLALFSRDITSNPNSAGFFVPETATYAGMITLLLAPLALLPRPRREAVFFILLAVFSLLMSVEWGPIQQIALQTPVIEGVKNWRLMVVVDLSLAVLAGLGITALARKTEDSWSRQYSWIAPTVTMLAAAYGIWTVASRTVGDLSWISAPQSTAMFLTLGYGLTMFRAFGGIGGRPFAVAALVLVSLDLISLRVTFMPFTPIREVFPKAPVFEFMKERTADAPYRIGEVDGVYPVNANIVYGLSSVSGYDVMLHRSKSFMNDFSYPSTGIGLNSAQIVAAKDRRIDLLNLKYLIATTDNSSYSTLAGEPARFTEVYTEGSVRVFENRRVLPQALFIPATEGAIEVLPDEEAQLARLKDPLLDPERSVVLPAMPEGFSGSVPAPEKPARITWEPGTENEGNLRITSSVRGVVVWSQSFYPGWKVFIDGSEVPVLRANYMMLAAAVPEGDHSIRFVFSPLSVRLGGVISMCAGLVVIGLGLYSLKRG